MKTLTIKVKKPISQVIVFGNYNNWDVDSAIVVKKSKPATSFTAKVPDNTTEFKVSNCKSWAGVEVDGNGQDINNRVINENAMAIEVASFKA